MTLTISRLHILNDKENKVTKQHGGTADNWPHHHKKLIKSFSLHDNFILKKDANFPRRRFQRLFEII